MKHSILILLLTCLPVMAETNYLSIAIREDIKDPDKTLSKLKLKDYFEDATELNWDDIPRWYKLTPSSNNWRIVSFAIDVGEVKNKNKNKKDIDDWVQTKISGSEREKIDVIPSDMNPTVAIEANGYKRIETMTCSTLLVL